MKPYDYNDDQLNRLKLTDVLRIKLVDESGHETNWMTLDRALAEKILELTKLMKVEVTDEN